MRKDAAPAQGIESCAREIPGRLRVLLGNLPSDVNLWGARVVIDVKALYGDVARLEDLPPPMRCTVWPADSIKRNLHF